jgi:hypothetical protein
MAVKNRGVLAAIKLGHTRIFINIKTIHDINRLSIDRTTLLSFHGIVLFRWSLELSFTYACFWLSRRVTKCRISYFLFARLNII